MCEVKPWQLPQRPLHLCSCNETSTVHCSVQSKAASAAAHPVYSYMHAYPIHMHAYVLFYQLDHENHPCL